MPHQVTMPMLGLTMEEGTITEWLKREGDEVKKEEPLFVVETDKSAVEVGAPATGVLSQIIVQVGQTARVSAPIAVIAQPGEAVAPAAPAAPVAPAPSAPPAAAPPPAVSAAAPAAPPAPASGGLHRVSPRARRVAQELGVDVSTITGTGPEGRVVEKDIRAAAAAPAAGGRIIASPLARKLASEHGVDLAQISGTGPGGRITEKDVTAYVDARAVPVAPAPPAAVEAAPAAAPVTAGSFEPLNRVRRITAERMAASSRSVARVTMFAEVDMTEAVRFRGQLAPEFERRHGVRLAYDAMIAKACATALAEHPHVNAQWQEASGAQPAGLRLQEHVNVGVAVSSDQGLLVAVIRDADKKSLWEVNSDLAGIVARARENKATPDDLTGGTFTVTNLGGYGVDSFTPIVNPPESAILAVGRIAKKPAVVDDQLAIRELMTLSLAFDHRVVDGAPAAQFLQRVVSILESPYILLA
ncbi:MAG: dihydrolipoamide acetyltransferase family protein [Chloroflexota bacterium]